MAVLSRKRRFDVSVPVGAHGRLTADPPTYRSLVASWHQGDEIPLVPGRTLRVLGVRDDDADQPPVLVVEDRSWFGH